MESIEIIHTRDIKGDFISSIKRSAIYTDPVVITKLRGKLLEFAMEMEKERLDIAELFESEEK